MSSSDPSVLNEVPPRHPASELQEALLATADIEAFLQQITDVAVVAIGGGIAVGITVARDGHPITVASSDGYAARLDEVQYGHDEGPCLTAMRAGKNVLIDDLLTEERFPPYRPGALALGVRSSLSLPLRGGKHAVGALNLYSRRPCAFGPLEQEKAQGFANEASRTLSLAVRLADSTEVTDQLRAALTSRTLIDQTIGIIMGQNRCNAEAAFAVLCAASQNRNVKLRDVAAEIITTVSTQPPQRGHAFEG
ncbi:MAG: GAF and ANTAR domain-containing protein [Cellulomonas sp.]|nr:GAF and ANTAR domain-containing protein [Cellulomonas sp.]